MERVHPHWERALLIPILPSSHVGLLVCSLGLGELVGKPTGGGGQSGEPAAQGRRVQVPAADSMLQHFLPEDMSQVEQSAQEAPHEITMKSATAEPVPPRPPSREAEFPCVATALSGLIALELATSASLPAALWALSRALSAPQWGQVLLLCHEYREFILR